MGYSSVPTQIPRNCENGIREPGLTFEVKALDGGAEAALHVVYATHPDGLGPKGDFWRETSARYLGRDAYRSGSDIIAPTFFD